MGRKKVLWKIIGSAWFGEDVSIFNSLRSKSSGYSLEWKDLHWKEINIDEWTFSDVDELKSLIVKSLSPLRVLFAGLMNFPRIFVAFKEKQLQWWRQTHNEK